MHKSCSQSIFQVKHGLDIMSNEKFIHASEIFKALQRKGKCKGHGEVESKKPITGDDFNKLTDYFKTNMKYRVNAKNLQDIVLFNIIYYMGRRGRENLRNMKRNKLALGKDLDE